MAEILDAALVRSGTWGQLWLDGELVAECYGCQIKLNKTKEDVARCRTLVAGKKMTAIAGTGTVRIYNATSRLIQAEGQALLDEFGAEAMWVAADGEVLYSPGFAELIKE